MLKTQIPRDIELWISFSDEFFIIVEIVWELRHLNKTVIAFENSFYSVMQFPNISQPMWHEKLQ